MVRSICEEALISASGSSLVLIKKRPQQPKSGCHMARSRWLSLGEID
jgi:hypothetical protein